MSEWKPIETAPRDGTVFLAWSRGHIAICAIVLESDEFEPQSWWDKFLRRPIKCIRQDDYYWYFAIPFKNGYARLNVHAGIDWNPTSWHPLPHPPEN